MNMNLEYMEEKALTRRAKASIDFWHAQVRESASFSDPFDFIFGDQIVKAFSDRTASVPPTATGRSSFAGLGGGDGRRPNNSLSWAYIVVRQAGGLWGGVELSHVEAVERRIAIMDAHVSH
jgi:hypothetical protein